MRLPWPYHSGVHKMIFSFMFIDKSVFSFSLAKRNLESA